jgi:hypothetical protein
MSLKAVASVKADKTNVNKIEHDDFEYAINDSQATQDINNLIKDDVKYYDSIVSTDSLSVVSDKLVDGLFRMWLDDNKNVHTQPSIYLADEFNHVFGQWFSSDKDGEQIFCNKFSHKEKKYAAQVKAIIDEVVSLVAKKTAIASSTEWIKSYNEYCGDFSDDDSDDKIGEKLVQGLVAFWHDAKDNGGVLEYNYLADILDQWIEHDEYGTGVLSIFFDGKQRDRRMKLIVEEAMATVDYQTSVNAAPKKDFVSKSIKDEPPSEIEKIKSGNDRIASMSSSKSTKNMSSSSSSSSDKTSDKVSKSSSSSSSSSSDKSSSSKTKKSVLELLTEKISQIVSKVVDDEEIAGVLIDAFNEKDNQDDLSKIILDWQKALLKTAVAKEKKVKKIKDPEAPKGKRTGYIIFCGEERASVKEDNPDMSPKLILTELGARWKALSDKKKAKYTKLAEADKARYDEEMSGYTPSDEFLEKKSKAEKESASGTKKKRERKAGPKRANSSYIFFCTEFRDKVKAEMEDGSDAKEVTKQLGAVWKNADDAVITLSNKDRRRFDKMAAEDKERYAEEKANWVDPSSSDSDSEKKEKPKPKKSSKSSSESSDDEESSSSAAASSDEDQPKSAKKGEAFANFAKKQRKRMSKKEDFADKTTEQVTAEIEEKWSGLSAEKQASYA